MKVLGLKGLAVRWRRDNRADDTTPSTELPVTTVEHGSFMHGFCTWCGWQGPGRRARTVAADDVHLHRLADCDPQTDVASSNDLSGVPDRERLSAHGRS